MPTFSLISIPDLLKDMGIIKIVSMLEILFSVVFHLLVSNKSFSVKATFGGILKYWGINLKVLDIAIGKDLSELVLAPMYNGGSAFLFPLSESQRRLCSNYTFTNLTHPSCF